MKPLLLVPAFLLLAGCAANSYCLGEQDYQSATSVPPLKPTAEGLKLPESSSALHIPPAPAKVVPYGEIVKDAEGDDQTVCLDRPPMMAAIAQPPPEPAAAPVSPPTVAPTPPEAVPSKNVDPVPPVKK